MGSIVTTVVMTCPRKSNHTWRTLPGGRGEVSCPRPRTTAGSPTMASSPPQEPPGSAEGRPGSVQPTQQTPRAWLRSSQQLRARLRAAARQLRRGYIEERKRERVLRLHRAAAWQLRRRARSLLSAAEAPSRGGALHASHLHAPAAPSAARAGWQCCHRLVPGAAWERPAVLAPTTAAWLRLHRGEAERERVLAPPTAACAELAWLLRSASPKRPAGGCRVCSGSKGAATRWQMPTQGRRWGRGVDTAQRGLKPTLKQCIRSHNFSRPQL